MMTEADESEDATDADVSAEAAVSAAAANPSHSEALAHEQDPLYTGIEGRFVCDRAWCQPGSQTSKQGQATTLLLGCMKLRATCVSDATPNPTLAQTRAWVESGAMTLEREAERVLSAVLSFSCLQVKLEMVRDQSGLGVTVHVNIFLTESMLLGRYMYQQAVPEVRSVVNFLYMSIVIAEDQPKYAQLLQDIHHTQDRLSRFEGMSPENQLSSAHVRALTDFATIDTASEGVPNAEAAPGFSGELLPHQVSSLARMIELSRTSMEEKLTVGVQVPGYPELRYCPVTATFKPSAEFNVCRGGILADDIGTGKTVVCAAYLAWFLQQPQPPSTKRCPALVVCQPTVLLQWEQHFARLCPQLRVAVLYGRRRADVATLAAVDVVLTSMDTLAKLFANPVGGPDQAIFRDSCHACCKFLAPASRCRTCGLSDHPGDFTMIRGKCTRCHVEERTEPRGVMPATCGGCGAVIGAGFWSTVIVDDAHTLVRSGRPSKRSRSLTSRWRAMMAVLHGGGAQLGRPNPVTWLVSGTPLWSGLGDIVQYAETLRMTLLPMGMQSALNAFDTANVVRASAGQADGAGVLSGALALGSIDAVSRVAAPHILRQFVVRHQNKNPWTGADLLPLPPRSSLTEIVPLSAEESAEYAELLTRVHAAMTAVEELELGARGVGYTTHLFSLLRRFCSGGAVSLEEVDSIVQLARGTGQGELIVVTKTTHDAGFNSAEGCPICMDALDEAVQITACRHAYCLRCISTYFAAGHRVCPLCRGDAGPKQLAKIVARAASDDDGAEYEALGRARGAKRQCGGGGVSRAAAGSASAAPGAASFKVRWLVASAREKAAADAAVKFVVLTQFPATAAAVATALDAAGLKTLTVRGSPERRSTMLEQFQTDATARVLVLLTTRPAAASGASLTKASEVYVMEPQDGDAVAQTVVRVDRLGQTRAVTVHQAVAAGTLEMEILNGRLAAAAATGSARQRCKGASEVMVELVERSLAGCV